MQQTDENTQLKQESFMIHYKPVHERLCRFVQSIIWNKEEAQDIINETALKAFEKFDMINNKEVFVNYLFGIAGNLAKKYYRKQKIKKYFEWEKSGNQESWQHSEGLIMNLELKKLLDKLSYDQRKAFSLFELSGFSYEEIANMENCSLSAIKSRIHNARNKLKSIVKSEEEIVKKIISLSL